jgi:hypothetical protein
VRRKSSRRRSPPTNPASPDPVRQHSLRPQEAAGAGGRPDLRALDGRGHARHGVLAQARRRGRSDLQAAVGRRFRAGNAGHRRASPGHRQGGRLDARPEDRLVRLRVADRPRLRPRGPGRGRPCRRVGARGARLRRPAPRRRLPLRRRERGPARLLDLRVQDGDVVAVRPHRQGAGARQRARAGAEGEARAGATDRARPQPLARLVRHADLADTSTGVMSRCQTPDVSVLDEAGEVLGKRT